ncbi:CBS domain-containing protein [Geomonas paludis]|uniref:CBS domain-containing protein n=1 Tax=Geomonas paludis TaxID=2740185 RepID=A0ABY4LHU7_9BACT|nr:CBS domain-containing protein [Geomonas paludis]UPU37437.1 CBS domain-containing protein [Geomonas paludis]
MPTQDLLDKIKEIKEAEKEFNISPRYLVNAFGFEKRTSGNRWFINRFLEEQQLETEPDYLNVWIDGEVTLRHKKKAKSKRTTDPIQRIKMIPAANREPVTVKKESSLAEATTLMRMHSYSQLPVISGPRQVIGYISWETIGNGAANGIVSDKVLPFTSKDIAILEYETPLLEAIRVVVAKEFAVVLKEDKSISGIVTLADVSHQFMSIAEPFLLLEEIENHVRQVLHGKLLVEEIVKHCAPNDPARKITHIDDLTFGEYVRIFEHPELWKKINLNVDKILFVKQLDKVREIRNEIMHFEPEGITGVQLSDLQNMSKFMIAISTQS